LFFLMFLFVFYFLLFLFFAFLKITKYIVSEQILNKNKFQNRNQFSIKTNFKWEQISNRNKF
jgi:hypothetical protein